MLRKVISVRNIGRLRALNPTGDVEFRRLTLIYGLNGRGKTTLCDILRSFVSRDGTVLAGRRTLASTGPQLVQLRTAEGPATFRDGQWDADAPRIAIFDTTFIHANVCMGNVVGLENRRNLYRVIVGERGVTLAGQVDALDVAVREQNTRISAQRTLLQAMLPSGMTLDQFIAIPDDPTIADRILSKERDIVAAQNVQAIRIQGELALLNVPRLPDNLETVLATTIESISEAAVLGVHEHLRAHTRNGEQWISQGLAHCISDACPFCGQDVQGLPLINIFRTFFGRDYGQLRDAVTALKATYGSADRAFTSQVVATVAQQNTAGAAFWNQYASVILPQLDLSLLTNAVNAVCLEAVRLLNLKAASLLDNVPISPAYTHAQEQLAAALALLTSYNAQVDAANQTIRATKASLATPNLPQLQRERLYLKAQQERHSDGARAACQQYQQLIDAKTELDNQKQEAREALNTHSARIFGQYQDRINEWLRRCGTSFSIQNTQGNFVGGRPQSTYSLVINGVPVSPGDENTPDDRASFKNTLSNGDRATLALAFFLAQLELDPNRASTVIVFDDPFTSQDRARRTCTYQMIVRLSTTAQQVVTLSHDPFFLKAIWDDADRATTKTLQLTTVGASGSISEWDIEECTRPEHEQNHRKLTGYRDDRSGDARDVAATIRLFLEGYLRCMFPNRFRPTEWLGDMIGSIRDCPLTDVLANMKDQVAELTEINDYSKRYHHSTNQQAATEPIDPDEVASFADRVLRLIGCV